MNIRNFCIIAHIDHGKSTLADRFLELTKTIPLEKMKPQYLDRMPLERERGITIKLQPVTMTYEPRINADSNADKRGYDISVNQRLPRFDGRVKAGSNQRESAQVEYTLNLIDTPGHVDFSYEVSRSLAAVEGAILLVDASQGIQAQTLANLYLAQRQNLTIIPVINKIDLSNIDLERVKNELSNLLKIKPEEIILASAKQGIGIEKILETVIQKVPAPSADFNKPLRALIFDSFYDEYRGVIIFVRIFDGQIKAGEKIKMLGSGVETEVLEVGIFRPDLEPKDSLSAGEIGYLATGLKEIQKCRVGDTVTIISDQLSRVEPLPGYQEVKPMVFAGLYPEKGSEIEKLGKALQKLKLNDASLFFEAERSAALGFGFRAGFLGLLHLDIVKERIKREFGLDLIITTPSVAYKIIFSGQDGKEKIIHRAQEMPDPSQIKEILEPWSKLEIITPSRYIGPIMKLVQDYQGQHLTTEYLGDGAVDQRAILHYQIPTSLLLIDFYDKLKSVSSGYASMAYEFLDYRPADLVKLDILVAGEKIEPLSTVVYRKTAYQSGRRMVEILKKVLPRQLFEVKIQAALGGKIIASEHLPPLRKDVTAKLYGGDVTRKMKLLAKQKRGKKKLLKLGKVDIPPEAYLAILKR
ncbi:MAG: translation elongation factor 4 [Patescibacteria group bacterium]